jgi:hypothetical protein
MGTKEKLEVAKEILATTFMAATENSAASGMQFKYKSYSVEEDKFKGWKFEIIVSELGYPDKTVQEFKFERPANIDVKNMEYNVILHVMTALTETAMLSWYQLAKMLNTDIKLQEEARKA